jgi:hypothetical protein
VWTNGREVTIIPGSDVFGRVDLLRAIYALGRELRSLGANVLLAQVPQRGGEKVGLDDYLVAGGAIGALEVLAWSLENESGCGGTTEECFIISEVAPETRLTQEFVYYTLRIDDKSGTEIHTRSPWLVASAARPSGRRRLEFDRASGARRAGYLRAGGALSAFDCGGCRC